MPFDPFKHHRPLGFARGRRSIRLKGFDYTQPGAYFVTVVTKYRECLFGNVSNGAMTTNEIGSIIQSIWRELPGRFSNIELDEFIVMPNHFHGIIRISETVGARLPSRSGGSPRPEPSRAGPLSRIPRIGKSPMLVARGVAKPRPYVVDMSPENNMMHAPTLGQIVAFFKYQTTKPINQIRGTAGAPIWQQNYHACPER